MPPRTEKILKTLRELPMTDLQQVIRDLKVGEEWIWLDENQSRAGSTAVEGTLTCIASTSTPASIVKGRDGRWKIVVETMPVGSAQDRKTAQDMAEAELELRGYTLPWRRR